MTNYSPDPPPVCPRCGIFGDPLRRGTLAAEHRNRNGKPTKALRVLPEKKRKILDTTAVPTLSEWGTIFLGLILAGAAIGMIRRREAV